MPILLRLTALLAISAAPSFAGSTLVDWGGDYIAGPSALLRSAHLHAPPEIGFVTGFLNDHLRSPSRDYASGPSSEFYGNAAISDLTLVNLAAITDTPDGDQLSVQLILQRNTTPPEGGATLEGHFLFHWPVPDSETGPAVFSLEARCIPYAEHSAIARWVLRIDDEWFVCDQVLPLGDHHTLQSARFTDLRAWHPFPARRSLVFTPGDATPLPAGKIKSLGFYLYARRDGVKSAEQIFRVDVRRFTVTTERD